jgi:hypothetical protein
MAAVRARPLSDIYRAVFPRPGPENGPRVEELRGLITHGPVGHRAGQGVSRNKVRVFCISQINSRKTLTSPDQTTMTKKVNMELLGPSTRCIII